MADSYGEFLMYSYLDILLPNMVYIDHYRPDWLKNPNTGYNLELDRYYTLGVGIEYQGELHAIDPKKQVNDMIKASLSKKHNTPIVYVEPVDLSTKKMKFKVRHAVALSGYPLLYQFFLSYDNKKALEVLDRKAKTYRKNLDKRYGPQIKTKRRGDRINAK